MTAESYFHVLFLDGDGFWTELAGGQFNSQFDAEKAAKKYHESSQIPSRVINQKAAILWDSTRDLHKSVEPSEIPFTQTR